MKVVILQPTYLPWLGYFDQYAWSDVFVIYDDVQYDRSWRNRNRIRGAAGAQWLTVPVAQSGQGRLSNAAVRIDNSWPWRRKQLGSLRHAYARSPYFSLVFPPLEKLLTRSWSRLLDLDLEGLRVLTQLLGLPWKARLASELGVSGRSTDRLVGVCRALGASDYLTGPSARAYLDESQFHPYHIKVHWHDYPHPVYSQGGKPFLPYLSVVDLLFWHGPDSLAILTSR